MGFKLQYGSTRRTPRLVPTSIRSLVSSTRILENLIQQIYKIQPEQVERIMVQQLGGSGVQGNLSDSGRIQVEVELVGGEVESFNWFVKVMPQNENSALTSTLNLFKNEIVFYNQILPEMKSFLREEGFAPEYAEFEVPEILYSREDEDGAIIVLQDILSEGFQHMKDENGDKFLSVEQAICAVKSLAKLQAVSVGFQQKRKIDLRALHPTLAESGLLWAKTEMTERLGMMKENYCEMLKQSSEVDSPTLLRRFKKSFDSAERLKELCQKRCKGNNKTLSLQHGDFTFNNLMFKREEGEGGRLRVMVVDWQLTYTGKTTGDLAYLLMSSLSQETREMYEDKIKSEYFTAYLGHLVKISSTAVEKDRLDTDSLPLSKDPLDHEYKDRLDHEYTDSLPLSFLLSCGNILSGDSVDKAVRFSYDMCKEAANKSII
jgi:thiamine kinase-like enzyme